MMTEFLGIILIDNAEIVLRIYKITSTKWQLLHMKKHLLPADTLNKPTDLAFIEALTDFLSAPYAQKVIDWRVCARNVQREIIAKIVHDIPLPIEVLESKREQELLCKGLCTEFW